MCVGGSQRERLSDLLKVFSVGFLISQEDRTKEKIFTEHILTVIYV
jgi:hypothetical protein